MSMKFTPWTLEYLSYKSENVIKITSVVLEIWLAKVKSRVHVYLSRCVYSFLYGICAVFELPTLSALFRVLHLKKDILFIFNFQGICLGSGILLSPHSGTGAENVKQENKWHHVTSFNSSSTCASAKPRKVMMSWDRWCVKNTRLGFCLLKCLLLKKEYLTSQPRLM